MKTAPQIAFSNVNTGLFTNRFLTNAVKKQIPK